MTGGGPLDRDMVFLSIIQAASPGALNYSVQLKGSFVEADRWSFRLPLVSLITVAALQLLCQLPGLVSLVLIPISLIIYGIAFFAIAAIAIYRFARKGSRTGASVLLAALLPVLLWRPINWVADVVHVGITVGLGGGQLGTPPKSSDDGFVVYDWSVGLAGGPNTFLIRDVTDEIASPSAQHAPPPRSEDGFEEECGGKVRRLISHYYVCSF